MVYQTALAVHQILPALRPSNTGETGSGLARRYHPRLSWSGEHAISQASPKDTTRQSSIR